MTRFFALVKTLLKQQLRGGQVRYDKNGKKKSSVGLFVILAVCFLPMLAMVAFGCYFIATLLPTELLSGAVTLLMLVCQGMVLLFSMANLVNNVFVAKDGERLLAMPFTALQIFCAKLFMVYVNEVVTTAVIVLALLLPFGIGAGMGVAYYLLMLLALLIIPMMPLLIECVLAIPISYLVNKLSGKGFLQTLVTAALFVSIMALYMWGLSSLYSMPEMIAISDDASMEEIVQVIMPTIQPVFESLEWVVFDFWYAEAMTTTVFLYGLGMFFAAIGTNLGVFAIALLIALVFYRRSVSQSLEHGTGKKASKHQGFVVKNQGGVLRQLIVCDIKRIMRQRELGFQILMMPVLLPLVVAIVAMPMSIAEDGVSVIDMISADSVFSVLIPLIVFGYLALLGSSTNVAAMYPISRERTSFYMMKVIPVSFERQLDAKLILAAIIMLVSYVLTGVVLVLVFPISWFYALLIPFAMSLYGYGSMCITMLLDLRKPILEWTSFQTSLKNSSTALFSMLIGFAILIAIALISILFILWYVASNNIIAIVLLWVAICVVGAVFALIARKFMHDRGVKYFENIGN